MATHAYYWEIRSAELDPSLLPVSVFVFGPSVEGAIVSAVRQAAVLKARLPGCGLPVKRVAELVEDHLCRVPPRHLGGDGTFVVYHVGNVGSFVYVEAGAERKKRRRRAGDRG